MSGFTQKYRSHFIAVIFGLSTSLVLAEVSVRIFFPHSRDHIIPGSLFQMDSDLGWSFQKDRSSRHQTKAFDVEYKINAFGYRDKARRSEKKSGTKRVFIYGDSQVFGWGLPMEYRYSNMLENRLADVEVWNLAVPAYGLDQEILSFEHNAKEFSPDIVVLFASQSTLGRTRYGYNYKKYKPQFVLDETGKYTLVPVPEDGRLFSDLLYKSIGWMYLPYFVEIRLEMLKSQAGADRPQTPVADPLREINKHILLRAKRVVEASGAQLVVLASLPEAKKQELEVFAKEHDIAFMHYELKGPKEDWILAPTDHHYNHRATTEITNQLERQLKTLLASPK